MKRKTIEVYALVVCFASVITFMISLGIGAYSFVRVVKPALTIQSWTYKMHQSNEAFRDQKLHENAPKNTVKKSEEEVTKLRLESWKGELAMERRTGFQTMVQCSIFIVISVFLYFFHWRLAKREKESA